MYPLRRDPHLAELIVYGLKLSLGVMFEAPFGVRDVIVAIRELVDNMLTHADWDQTPAPSLFIRYHLHTEPTLRNTSISFRKQQVPLMLQKFKLTSL